MDTLAVFEDIIRRESRSLPMYVLDSLPWPTANHDLVIQLERVLQEEKDGIGALVRFLARHHQVAPHPDPFPIEFTTCNYTSLAHLLPRLVDALRRSTQQMEKDCSRLRDPEARELAAGILAAKRRHLQELERLASPVRQSVKS